MSARLIRAGVIAPLLSLGVWSGGAGCGGSAEHPLIQEGVSPYEKAKASKDAYKLDMEKRKGARPTPGR